jgi:EAL domain-containing protein (putative c-di-GMP-specific phosphodiesterase class I)
MAGETVAAEENRIAGRIQHALDLDGFELFYQPIVSLKGDRQEHYNLLLRLREEDGALREAEEFLPIAERSGTMAAIDRWVLGTAIAELAVQRAKGLQVNFFVDIAEVTLLEERLLVWICDHLRNCKARGNWLTLQVLEEHARGHATVFARLSDALRRVGCRIALNHFEEDQHPELLLRSAHVDYVEFPPDLGSGLADDRAKQRRLLELINLCRDNGVKSVVTGVEDARSLTLLWAAGIDYVQGSFVQRPGPGIHRE